MLFRSIKSKLIDRGFPCIFIGHTEDHAPNVYLFYNIQTKATLLSRNVIWLNKKYSDYKNDPSPIVSTEDIVYEFEGSSSLQIPQPILPQIPPQPQIPQTTPPPQFQRVNTPPSPASPYTPTASPQTPTYTPPPSPPASTHTTSRPSTPEFTPRTTSSDTTPQAENTTVSSMTTTTPTTPLFSPCVRGLDREIYNLTTAYNPDPRVHMEDLVHYAFTTITPAMDIYPSTYYDAMKHKDNSEWWKAMKLEFTNAESKGVWKIIKKSDLPKGRKLVGNRWVYTQKDDGRFRARTVAKIGRAHV